MEGRGISLPSIFVSGVPVSVYDIEIEQGTTWQMAWPVTDDDGDDIDLTGYTARAQVRTTAADSLVLHEWDSAEGTIILSNSQVILQLEPADSAQWTWRMGVYDILLTSGAGESSRISEGAIRVRRAVTR